jgi:Tfp pilus assembly protein PilE
MQKSKQTDVLGIVSIIIDVLGMPVIGIILGAVGEQQAKKKGYSPVLSRIGWILGIVLTVLGAIALLLIVYLSVPALQQNSRDTQRKNELSNIQLDLSNYYSENLTYPTTLDAVPGDYQFEDDYEYSPTPAGCTTNCTGYTLTADLESRTTPYVLGANR